MNFLVLALFFHSAYSLDYGMKNPRSIARTDRISWAVFETASSFSEDFPLSDPQKQELRYWIESTLYDLDKASNWNDLIDKFRYKFRALRYESITAAEPMADVKGAAFIFIAQMLARKYIESLSYDAPHFFNPPRELVNVSRNVAVVFSFFGLLSVVGFDSQNFFRDQFFVGVSPWIIARAAQYFHYAWVRKNFSDLLMGTSFRKIVRELPPYEGESAVSYWKDQTLLNRKEIRRIWEAYRNFQPVCDDLLSGSTSRG